MKAILNALLGGICCFEVDGKIGVEWSSMHVEMLLKVMAFVLIF